MKTYAIYHHDFVTAPPVIVKAENIIGVLEQLVNESKRPEIVEVYDGLAFGDHGLRIEIASQEEIQDEEAWVVPMQF